jgi:CRISPR-associated protein Cas2
MVVLLLERVPVSLRGELSRWMIEPKTGVFVGRVSARVRDKLWEKVCAGVKGGAATLVYSALTEQGFAVKSWGNPNRTVVDWEGLQLIRVPLPTRDKVKTPPQAVDNPVDG